MPSGLSVNGKYFMKKFAGSVLFILSFTASFSQSPGPFFRQFLFNPYLFNPAYVGINEHPELNLVHRKQWINFNDAPETSGISLQYPTAGKVSLGFNLYSDKQVLLRTSSFMATFGYAVPISENHTLRFGLSGGVGMNRLDLTADELNTNDPAIINAAGNNYFVDGNFGVVYAHEGLQVGFALTEIFKSDPFNSQEFNEFSMSNLRNRIYSASYKFDIDIAGDVVAEPYVLYRQSEDALQDAWEAGSMFYIKERLWTGASYNQNRGLALFLGMNIMDKFRFSYSYEFPPFNTNFISTSSHELHLGIRFGKKKSKSIIPTSEEQPRYTEVQPEPEPEPKQEEDTVQPEQPEPVQPVVVPQQPVEPEPAPTPQPEPVPETKTLPQAPPQETPTQEPPVQIVKEEAPVVEEPAEPVRPVGKPPRTFTLAQGHYVVVGAFSIMAHSTKFSRDLMNQGYEVSVGLNPKKRLYYVYIFSTYDLEEARRVRNQYRLRHLFREAWVFTME